jgi:hypothetical protein
MFSRSARPYPGRWVLMTVLRAEDAAEQ